MDDSKHSDEIDDQSMNVIQLMAMNHSEIQRWIIENYSNKSISSRNKLYEVYISIFISNGFLINFNQ